MTVLWFISQYIASSRHLSFKSFRYSKGFITGQGPEIPLGYFHGKVKENRTKGTSA